VLRVDIGHEALRGGFTQALAGEAEAVGVVNEAIRGWRRQPSDWRSCRVSA
jgi:hypothetical protein